MYNHLMSNTPNKRMIYIWPENLEFYDGLKNKSEVINQQLNEMQKNIPEQLDIETELQRKLKQIDANAADKLT